MERRDGPADSAPRSSDAVIRPQEEVAVTMAPGGSGGIGIQVDNANYEANPVRYVVLWVEGANGHVRIPIDPEEAAQAGEGAIYRADFDVPPEICAQVCNQDIQLRCHKAAMTADGSITASNVALVDLQCSGSGDPAACEPPAAPEAEGSTTSVGPGSSGVVTMTVENPDDATDPVVGTVIWMEGSDSHIILPADGAMTSGTVQKTLANGFVVTQDICEGLCNIAHQVKCHEMAVTESGVVTAANITEITVQCAETGNPSECGGGGAAPAPSAGGDCNEFCQTLATYAVQCHEEEIADFEVRECVEECSSRADRVPCAGLATAGLRCILASSCNEDVDGPCASEARALRSACENSDLDL